MEKRKFRKSKVRLIQSQDDWLPIGTIGICRATCTGYYIQWENYSKQKVKELETDSCQIEVIIPGFNYLTFADVYRLSNNQYDEIYEIKDLARVNQILEEFRYFNEYVGFCH